MLTPEEHERIRRAYYVDKKSLRQIAREERRSRETIKKAVSQATPKGYHLKDERPAPIFGPFQERVEELLAHNEQRPPKQHYPSHKIFELIQAEGYTGCESRIRTSMGEWNRTNRTPDVFLPLAFEPGQDAQCDWGEAIANIRTMFAG